MHGALFAMQPCQHPISLILRATPKPFCQRVLVGRLLTMSDDVVIGRAQKSLLEINRDPHL